MRFSLVRRRRPGGFDKDRVIKKKRNKNNNSNNKRKRKNNVNVYRRISIPTGISITRGVAELKIICPLAGRGNPFSSAGDAMVEKEAGYSIKRPVKLNVNTRDY